MRPKTKEFAKQLRQEQGVRTAYVRTRERLWEIEESLTVNPRKVKTPSRRSVTPAKTTEIASKQYTQQYWFGRFVVGKSLQHLGSHIQDQFGDPEGLLNKAQKRCSSTIVKVSSRSAAPGAVSGEEIVHIFNSLPGMYDQLTVTVSGSRIYGTPQRPFVGLQIASNELLEERARLLTSLTHTNSVLVGAEHAYNPHISLVRLSSPQMAQEVLEAVTGLEPETVTLAGISYKLS